MFLIFFLLLWWKISIGLLLSTVLYWENGVWEGHLHFCNNTTVAFYAFTFILKIISGTVGVVVSTMKTKKQEVTLEMKGDVERELSFVCETLTHRTAISLRSWRQTELIVEIGVRSGTAISFCLCFCLYDDIQV